MRPSNVAALLTATLLVVSSCTPAPEPSRSPITVIHGTVRPAEGGHFKLAQVHLTPSLASATPLATARVAPDGHFAIATTDTGTLDLTFSAVDHYSKSVTLVLPERGSIAVDARLEHYTYAPADSLDHIKVRGSFNAWSWTTARPLTKQKDGTYALEVPTTDDSVTYELVGLESPEGRSINGTQSDTWVYDGRGDYRSVVAAKNGHATIVFDPKLLQRDTGTATVVFQDTTTSRDARLSAMVERWTDQRDAYFDTVRAVQARKDTLHYDWAPVVASRTTAFQAATDPLARQLYALSLLDALNMGAKLDTALARTLTHAVPAASPFWDLFLVQPTAIVGAYRVVAGDTSFAAAWKDTAVARPVLAYLDSVVAAPHDTMVVVQTLTTELSLAKSVHDDQLANDYYNRLVTDYASSPFTSLVKAQFSPNRLIQVGRKMPAYSVGELGDSAAKYTNRSMLGKVYLLDFWATWCGPCVAELPNLDAAYDSLHSRGLQILSVSLDQSPKDVVKFRADHRMPWPQGFVSGGFENAEMKRLQILFLPREVLIGKNGTILAADDQLRGKDLMPTLKKAFGISGAP